MKDYNTDERWRRWLDITPADTPIVLEAGFVSNLLKRVDALEEKSRRSGGSSPEYRLTCKY